MNNILTFIIEENFKKARLDKVLSDLSSNLSRTIIQKYIKNGHVTVNDLVVTNQSYLLECGDKIQYQIVDLAKELPLISSTDISLDIVYEDEYLIIVNKQPNLTVHPGAGNSSKTLVNALMHYTNNLSDIGGMQRPGIVHRLDKDTSGLMVVAKNNIVHANLANQIVQRSLIRKYKALVYGLPSPTSGLIDINIGRCKFDHKKMNIMKIGGKAAKTNYRVIEVFAKGTISLIECKLETGRTHQIRVHLSHIGHSIIGDQTYGHNTRKASYFKGEVGTHLQSFKRQGLHSYYIGFNHPVTQKFIDFQSQIWPDMLNLIEILINVD